MMTESNPRFLDTTGQRFEIPAPVIRKKTRAADKKSLRCKACGHIISSEDERIMVNSRHFHTCTNPSGFVYDIGCFRNAPGCAQVGPATAEYTWFAGYTWQIAVCSNCGEHLGWRYRGGDVFYGLIIAQLTSTQ